MSSSDSETDLEDVKPFPFLQLPAELRQRVYRYFLHVEGTIDLDPFNYRHIARRLNVLQTCRQMHDEASQSFYGEHPFRIFPTHGRFFHTRRVLLSRMSRRHRQKLKTLELRLGPGWSKPPKSWVVNAKLGLHDCKSVRVLEVFVECDPSHDIFRGFRLNEEFYTNFSGSLLHDIFVEIPSIEEIRFDAFPSVSKTSPLMSRLVMEATQFQISVVWGPTFDIDQSREDDACALTF
ncbi:MAG: hypothetical protein M1817_002240 [Caeruleum heppii]|nr:MAG: hypothetical protein M1817_002240 [Caeruleum heppii]